MISESTTTQFSSIIFESIVAYLCWRFVLNGVVNNKFVLYWIVLATTNQFSLLNYIVCSELVLAAELCCLQRISFHCWIMLSAASQFLLPNCIVSSESVVAAKLCFLLWVNSRCQIVFPAANQLLLLNYVVCSESVFVAELWCQQRISPLMNLHH